MTDQMTEHERLQRDIVAMRESIRLGWVDMTSKPLTPDERRELRIHIAALVSELADLLGRLE